ncbi:MAG: DUF4190 domain-containing protein [Agathobacter sp.]|nr:DUF4190 domain-containing protein [Agathobacter sp.]
MSDDRMYENISEEVVEENETVGNSPIYEAPVFEESVVQQEPVKAKKGFATACLVFGIFAFLTTLFLINYVFGILSLIFGIIYLAKKADIKPKGKAIAGIVLTVISLVISTSIWVSAYMYFVKTDVYTIMEDAAGVLGEEIDGRETINQMLLDSTGGKISIDMVEEFLGGEVSLERLIKFIGDVNEMEITDFINELSEMDPEKLEALINEFQGEVTYEKLEEKLGKDFNLRDLMDYVRGYVK